MRFFHTSRGFSLVEMLGVISIILILLSVVLFNLQAGKQKARDVRRIAELNEIALAIRLYEDARGERFSCINGMKIDGQTNFDPGNDILAGDGGTQCDDGDEILTAIVNHMTKVPHDPLGPGSSDYYYYFDTAHACDTPSDNDSTLLFAVNHEYYDTNFFDVCTQPTLVGHDGGLTNTVQFGGSKDPSAPYVIRYGNRFPRP